MHIPFQGCFPVNHCCESWLFSFFFETKKGRELKEEQAPETYPGQFFLQQYNLQPHMMFQKLSQNLIYRKHLIKFTEQYPDGREDTSGNI
jgi:hypothetical protein